MADLGQVHEKIGSRQTGGRSKQPVKARRSGKGSSRHTVTAIDI
jgi:hypothetical protein